MGRVVFDDLPDEASLKRITFDDIPMQEEKAYSLGRTIFEKGLQGVTSAFSDEISAPLAATYAALRQEPKSLFTGEITDPALAEQISTAPQQYREMLSKMSEDRPVTSTVSEIGGAIAPAITLGGTGAAAGLTNWLGRGGTAARMGKAYLAAVPSTAAYMYGQSEGNIGERAKDVGAAPLAYAAIAPAAVGAGAALGGISKSAIKGVKNIRSGIYARDAEELDDAAMAIKNVATQQYAKMREAGAVFSPTATQNIQEKISQTLAKDGALNPKLHDKVLAVYDDISQGLSKGGIGLEDLDQWRQVLGDIAGNFGDKVNARKATLMMNSIDDVVDNVTPQDLISGGKEAVDALKAGREAWARQSRFRTISDVVKNSGNDVNKLKRDLTKILLNPKKTRGFSKQELEYLKEASRQTTGEGIMKMVGKFGFDIGSGSATGNTGLPVITGALTGLGSLATGGTGGIGVAIPAIGTAARSTQKALGYGKADELLRVIESGGQISKKAIDSLPQNEKSAFLSRIAVLQPWKEKNTLNAKNKIKEYIKDESGSVDLSYMMRHRPPNFEDGARLDDMTGGGRFYPDDIYSDNALQYYRTGDKLSDAESMHIIKKVRGNPDANVTIYRAVPKNAPQVINSGDWVTLSKNYAKQHGISNIKNGYKVISKKVKAKNITTNADSINEFGYWE
jgi:hypothetical protein